jgi:hypothetical protein
MNRIKNNIKTLIDNGIRFKNYTDQIEIEEIIRHKEQNLTLSKEELNKLYLEARHDYRYIEILRNEFLVFSFTIDEYIIGKKKLNNNIDKISEIKNEFFNHEILCMDLIKSRKEIRIIMIKKDDISLLENENDSNNDIIVNKVIKDNIVDD